MNQKNWKDVNGNFHRVDESGNYFINRVCQNPDKDSGKHVGYNIPKA